ncbi:hypothetical protein ACFYSF_05015 [Streptomyces canus]|uniref:hypothetical protein n=1 Tax=Streptomyces canus TaxID=58343 RepID=UPI0036A2A155
MCITKGGELRCVRPDRAGWALVNLGNPYPIKGVEPVSWQSVDAVKLIRDFGAPPCWHAAQLLRVALAHEPDLTELMFAGKAECSALDSAIDLAGLNHRVKSAESTIRKLANIVRIFGMNAQEASTKIDDTLRYSVTVENLPLYVPAVERVSEALMDAGARVLKAADSFIPGSRFKGLSAHFMFDFGGQIDHVFEVQFYHLEAWEIYTGRHHKLYEIARWHENPIERRQEAVEEMIRISDTVEIPPGLDRLRSENGLFRDIGGYKPKSRGHLS